MTDNSDEDQTLVPLSPELNFYNLLQVGTYIGERLIYAPSIGFCILLAEALAKLAGDALPQILLLWYSGQSTRPLSIELSAFVLSCLDVIAIGYLRRA